MIKKTVILLLLLAASVSFAAAKPIRSGVIIAAELTRSTQNISGLDPVEFPQLPQNKLYASVTLKLFYGRALSRHDYSLQVYGTNFPCVAIRVGNGPWKSRSGDIPYSEKNRVYSMLFVIDGASTGLNPVEKLSLKCNYQDGKYALDEVNFTNLGQKNFTPPTRIPASGNLAEKK